MTWVLLGHRWPPSRAGIWLVLLWEKEKEFGFVVKLRWYDTPVPLSIQTRSQAHPWVYRWCYIDAPFLYWNSKFWIPPNFHVNNNHCNKLRYFRWYWRVERPSSSNARHILWGLIPYWNYPTAMVSLLRTLRSFQRVGFRYITFSQSHLALLIIHFREWFRQMQYVGDAKSGRFVGHDQWVPCNRLIRQTLCSMSTTGLEIDILKILIR